MKKSFIIAIVFLLSLGSCKKFLETEPTDFLNPSNYYDTEAQLEYARASAYNNLGTGQLWGSWANYLLGFQADEGYMNRFTLTSGPWNYFYSSADPYASGFWSNLYNGINRANVVLENLDKNTEIAQEKRDKIRGEMLFLRGYYYFMLVQYYGGVPIKTEPTNSVVDVDIPRNTVKEVYTQIVTDMEAAEPLVPGIKTLGYGGAVNKSAVRGMLARVNLHMAGEPLKDKTRYAEASKWAKKVIDDAEAGHALNPSYAQVFMNLAGDKYDIKECLWEVEFFGNRTDQYIETTNNGWINGPRVSSAASYAATGRADAYMSITSKLYNSFEIGDNRKWWSTAGHFSYIAGPNGAKKLNSLPSSEAVKDSYNPGKWRREFEKLLPKNSRQTPENVVIMRYSDVLLMYAEAENEIKGPTAESIEAMNKVRRRAWSTGVRTIEVTNGGSGYTTVPTVVFSGNGDAKATATISGGKVTAIILDRDASGVKYFQEGAYTSAPMITISGGGGSGAAALATINKATDGNLSTAQTTSKGAFLASIQNERLREFNFEGLRKGDLLRWGIFLQVFQDMGNQLQQDKPGAPFVKYFSNVSSRDLLMPIPNKEISTNKAMVQNPGWN